MNEDTRTSLLPGRRHSPRTPPVGQPQPGPEPGPLPVGRRRPSRRRNRLGSWIALIPMLFPCGSFAADFQVIVHGSNVLDALAPDEVSKLFLRKTRQWPDGLAVAPVDLPAASAIREAFSEAIHGRSASKIESYWRQQLFGGEAVPPAELESDAAVIEFVGSEPGAIGYVSAGASLQGVKRLQITSAAAADAFRDLSPDDTPPRLVESTQPAYPIKARRAGYECRMEVAVKIDERGRVREFEVLRPCDQFAEELDRSAERAILQWVFEPARSAAGEAIRVRHRFVLTFTLEE